MTLTGFLGAFNEFAVTAKRTAAGGLSIQSVWTETREHFECSI